MAVILSTDTGATDSIYHTLIKHIDTPIDIVLVSWDENYRFNPHLLKLKDYCLIDFCEEGWDVPIIDTHIFGKNSEKFPRYYNGDWVKFDDWVKANPPKITFKRELLKKDVTDKVLPIEYPCVVHHWEVDSEERFNNRPISCFQYWGRSNENRLRIHGDIWHHATRKGFSVCDNIYYINKFLQEERGGKWVTLWIPHYERIDINNLMPLNAISKLSLSWPGAGFKCFRTGEAPANSIMVMHRNEFSWAYDWNETNCILVEPGKEMEGIDEALDNPMLYQIYKAGVENCDRYRLPNYLNHIQQKIKEVI